MLCLWIFHVIGRNTETLDAREIHLANVSMQRSLIIPFRFGSLVEDRFQGQGYKSWRYSMQPYNTEQKGLAIEQKSTKKGSKGERTGKVQIAQRLQQSVLARGRDL